MKIGDLFMKAVKDNFFMKLIKSNTGVSSKNFFLVMNFAEKSVHFYLSQVLTSFSEIAIWLHSAGMEFEDLLGTNPDLSFR